MGGTLEITCAQMHPRLAVADAVQSASWYADKLGFRRGGDMGADWAQVFLDEVEVHLVRGAPAPASVYFVVDDVDHLHRRCAAAGVTTDGPPRDQPYGLREFSCQDDSGHHLVFGQHVAVGPPIEVVRDPLTLRLERRLAAVLRDLAAASGADVGPLVEDVLMHSFEGASPWTGRLRAEITRLLDQHGVDYDAHDLRRFTERP